MKRDAEVRRAHPDREMNFLRAAHAVIDFDNESIELATWVAFLGHSFRATLGMQCDSAV